LQDLGTKKPQDVPIRKMFSDAAQFYRVPGVTRSTGIWLNKDTFFTGPLSSQQIYMLAHQAAYYNMSKRLSVLTTFKCITDKLPVTLPFIDTVGNFFMLRQIYQKAAHPESVTKKMIIKDALLLTAIHWLPPLIHNLLKGSVILFSKNTTKKIDLAAAHLLCKHGNVHIVKDVIKQLEMDIMQGKVTGPLHPAPQEIRNYLQEFVRQWETESSI
jgi:hypothetical protein